MYCTTANVPILLIWRTKANERESAVIITHAKLVEENRENYCKYDRIFVIQLKKNLFDTIEINSRMKKFTYQKKYTENFRSEKTY